MPRLRLWQFGTIMACRLVALMGLHGFAALVSADPAAPVPAPSPASPPLGVPIFSPYAELPPGAAEPKKEPPAAGEAPKPTPLVNLDPRSMQVEFADGSQLRVLLADDHIEIETPHGKLSVPAGQVRQIEFAPRVAPAAAARLKELLPKISSTVPAEREAAVREILGLGEAAIPAVEELAKKSEAESAEYAADLLTQLQKPLPKGRRILAHDQLQTADSKIIGLVTMPELKITTAQFGQLSMHVRDVRSLRSLALVLSEGASDDEEVVDEKNALPDPGNLSSYAGQVGKTLLFRVTGAADSSIWGTTIYTTDSDLSTAAVHAGAVEAGKTAVVRVKMLPGQEGFAGTTQNGVSSNSYDSYPTAYEIVTKKRKSR